MLLAPINIVKFRLLVEIYILNLQFFVPIVQVKVVIEPDLGGFILF